MVHNKILSRSDDEMRFLRVKICSQNKAKRTQNQSKIFDNSLRHRGAISVILRIGVGINCFVLSLPDAFISY